MWRAGPFKVYRSLRNGLIRRHLGVADRTDGRTRARPLRPNRAAKGPFLEKGRLQIRARHTNGVPFSANSPAAPNLVPLVSAVSDSLATDGRHRHAATRPGSAIAAKTAK